MFIFAICVLMAFLAASTYPSGKFLMRQVDPVSLTFARYAICSGTLLPFWIFRGAQKLQRRDVAPMFFLSFVGVSLFSMGLYAGLYFTTISHSALLITTHPILTAIFGYFIAREPFNRMKLLGILLAFAGVALVVVYGKIQPAAAARNMPLGDLISIAAAAGWASYAAFSKKWTHRYDPLTVSTYTIFMGTLGVFPFALGFGLFRVPFVQGTLSWSLVLYSGITTGLLFVIFLVSLKATTPTYVASFFFLVPVMAAFLGWGFLGERLTLYFLAGMALVILGLFFVSRGQVKAVRGAARGEA